MKPDPASAFAKCRALLITAAASAQGKTTVTAVLARYFSRQGKVVRVFKCGPDFIDPMILELACGNPVYQLDLWMVGEEECRQRVAAAAQEADLILIEGVMGLFDGKPSTADLAVLFGIPLLAVIDSKGMAQSFGAVAYGLAAYRPELRFAAVLANRVAGESHAAMLAENLPSEVGRFAWLARDDSLEFASRHLGLLQASEIDDLERRLDHAADLLEVPPLEELVDEIEFDAAVKSELPLLLKGVRIAVAQDEAFGFIYRANCDCLVAMGAELRYFSPLHDSGLPDADSLWLPGGYPELYAEQLAANCSMKAAIVAHHEAEKPIFAECGGMLYLAETLTDKQGETISMLGVLAGDVIMQKRLVNLGMHSINLCDGELRCHTFHYSKLETPLAPLARSKGMRKGFKSESFYRQGRLCASYLHPYFLSNPKVAARLFAPSASLSSIA